MNVWWKFLFLSLLLFSGLDGCQIGSLRRRVAALEQSVKTLQAQAQKASEH